MPRVSVLLTDEGSRRVYVGRAVDVRQRLQQHPGQQTLDWRQAAAIKRDT